MITSVVNLFQMVTLLVVQSDAHDFDDDGIKIQLREFRNSISGSNGYSREVVVKGNRQPKTMTATKFTSGCHYGGRAATVKVFVNGVDSGKGLLPSDFVDHVKIVFNIRATRGGQFRLTSIEGVPALSSDTFTSLGIFNIFGPNLYEERPLTRIHRSHVAYPSKQ